MVTVRLQSHGDGAELLLKLLRSEDASPVVSDPIKHVRASNASEFCAEVQ